MRMMRFAVMVGLVTALTLSVGVAGPEETNWFDAKNCAMCKNLGAEEGLLENMRWETHKISNGMLSVAVIPEEYEEKFARAAANMNKVAKEMQGGTTPHLCGFCTNYGMLMMSGATAEELHTDAGHISLVTASDSEVIEKIHKHADKTVAEYKKMMAGEAPYDRVTATN